VLVGRFGTIKVILVNGIGLLEPLAPMVCRNPGFGLGNPDGPLGSCEGELGY
jgi:hypothetical protein